MEARSVQAQPFCIASNPDRGVGLGQLQSLPGRCGSLQAVRPFPLEDDASLAPMGSSSATGWRGGGDGLRKASIPPASPPLWSGGHPRHRAWSLPLPQAWRGHSNGGRQGCSPLPSQAARAGVLPPPSSLERKAPRTWKRSAWGAGQDRDINAAKNVLAAGLAEKFNVGGAESKAGLPVSGLAAGTRLHRTQQKCIRPKEGIPVL